MLTLNKDSETDGLVSDILFKWITRLYFSLTEGSAKGEKMISGATFSVADVTSGVLFVCMYVFIWIRKYTRATSPITWKRMW